MKKGFIAFLWTVLSTGSPVFLSAQQDYSLTDTIPLSEVIVVSGTKTQVKLNQIPSTVSVVTREELEESSESAILSILSERIPGLFVTERGVTGFGLSSGSAGVVNIHGVGSGNKVLMLFDGQPQWAGIFGHHLPDMYVSSDAERVEVVRGPASLLYGSSAMGGAINVITRKAEKDGIHGRGRVMYGSYNTQKYMLNAGGKKDKFNAYLSLNHDRTDGQRGNSDFEITNGYAKAGYDFSDNWKASANVILANIQSDNPGSVVQPMIDNWVDALRGTYSLSVENNYQKMSGSIQGFYNFGHHEVNDGWNMGQPRPYLFHSDDYNAGFALYESFHFLPGNLITTGVDFKQWGGHAWNDSVNGNQGEIIDKSVYELASYVLSQQALTKKITLNMGVRLEMNETYGDEWVPQVGIAYNSSLNSTLKASVSKGFRSPNIRELYMYMPANPDLQPEYMNNYDASYLQKLLNGKMNVELTLYFIDGKNMIQTVVIDSKPKNMNSGSFINKGFELAVNYQLLPELKLSGNYSFLETSIPLTGAPKHQVFLYAGWRISRFQLSSNFQYVGGLYTLTGANPQKEDYGLLDAKLTYQAANWISIFINGENLTDTDYEINEGFPMPGVVVMGGIDFKF